MVFRSKERAAPHPRHGVGVGEGPTALRTRVTRRFAGGSDTLATRTSTTSTTARVPTACPTPAIASPQHGLVASPVHPPREPLARLCGVLCGGG